MQAKGRRLNLLVCPFAPHPLSRLLLTAAAAHLSLRSWDESTFAAIDAIVAEKHEKAKASKCCLRHVSSMDVGESSIKIRFMEVRS